LHAEVVCRCEVDIRFAVRNECKTAEETDFWAS